MFARRLQGLLQFRLEPNESRLVAEKLAKLKREEERLFSDLNLAELHVPKTVPGLL
jgi:hypothetical protein